MNALYELQRGLYGGVLDALKTLQTQGWESYPGLIAAAFSFGLLHALLPGHGKSVLAACYAGDGRMSGAVMSSIVLIVTHVGSAIVLVLGGFAVLQRTIVGAGRAPLATRPRTGADRPTAQYTALEYSVHVATSMIQ